MSNQFAEIFEIELKCWCHGLERVKERIDNVVLHKVIKDFSPVFKEAIENLYAFDVVEAAKRLVTAAKCRNQEREIVFYILSHLPIPAELTAEQIVILEQIVSGVEKIHAGAFKRLEKKWSIQVVAKPQSNKPTSLAELSFPPRALAS